MDNSNRISANIIASALYPFLPYPFNELIQVLRNTISDLPGFRIKPTNRKISLLNKRL